jgi:REP element-mobilizing transposase RayT
MNENPVGFFITWTCYGTWMPGDDRGWTKWHKGDQIPQPLLADWCREQMSEPAVTLNATQRQIVNDLVLEHCNKRGWHLHAVNCRSNHCHVVVSASNYDGEVVRDQLKAWSSRRLNESLVRSELVAPHTREHWWTRKGSVRHLSDEDSLAAAILYTRDAQDAGGSKSNT